MDLVILLARLILVAGCGLAALMPSVLGRSDTAPLAPVVVSLGSSWPVEAGPLPAKAAAVALPVAGGFEALEPGGAWREETTTPVRFRLAAQVRLAPRAVRIPSQSIEARVEPVGVTDAGVMESPSAYDQVGWYRYGALPGESGRAVLAGHYDSHSGAAIFYRLGNLQPGDRVEVVLATGETRVFAVRELAEYPVEDAPLVDIFGHVDRPELVLITCSGEFRGPEAGYSHRLIVYAELVER